MLKSMERSLAPLSMIRSCCAGRLRLQTHWKSLTCMSLRERWDPNFLARLHGGDFGLVLTHTFVHSTEIDREKLDRQLVPLTPEHTVGIVGTWEREAWGRIGIDAFYTGVQTLDDNPYRRSHVPYWLF